MSNSEVQKARFTEAAREMGAEGDTKTFKTGLAHMARLKVKGEARGPLEGK